MVGAEGRLPSLYFLKRRGVFVRLLVRLRPCQAYEGLQKLDSFKAVKEGRRPIQMPSKG